MVQLARTSRSQREDFGFEPRWGYHMGRWRNQDERAGLLIRMGPECAPRCGFESHPALSFMNTLHSRQ